MPDALRIVLGADRPAASSISLSLPLPVHHDVTLHVWLSVKALTGTSGEGVRAGGGEGWRVEGREGGVGGKRLQEGFRVGKVWWEEGFWPEGSPSGLETERVRGVFLEGGVS